MIGHAAACDAWRRDGTGSDGCAGIDCQLEIGVGDPEIAQRFDRCGDRGDLLARVDQELEHADQHGVVAQDVLVRDALAQREDDVAIAACDLVRRAVRGEPLAHFGAGRERHLRGALDALHVRRLGARDARVAPVEERHLHLDLEAVLTRSAGLAFVRVAGLEHVDEAGCAKKPEARRHRRRVALCELHIHTTFERDAFGVAGIDGRCHELRQTRGKNECGRVGETEQACQALALDEGELPRLRELRLGLRLERLFAQLRERAHVAGGRHASGQVGTRVGRRLHVLEIADPLLRGDRSVPRPLHHPCVREDVSGDTPLRRLARPRGHVARQWRNDERHDVEEQRAVDRDRLAAAPAAEDETRVREASRLYEIRLGDTEVGEARAHRGAIEQRDLHGRIRRERLREQALHLVFGRRGVRHRRQARSHAEAFLHDALHRRDGPFARQDGAACERSGNDREGDAASE